MTTAVIITLAVACLGLAAYVLAFSRAVAEQLEKLRTMRDSAASGARQREDEIRRLKEQKKQAYSAMGHIRIRLEKSEAKAGELERENQRLKQQLAIRGKVESAAVEDAVHIKSAELCERCLYGDCLICCTNCGNFTGEICRCQEIQTGTPCEYFMEGNR